MGLKRLGIDLGGTQIKAGIVEEGRVTEELTAPTPSAKGYEQVLDAVGAAARPFLERHPGITEIGVGVPGLIDATAGTVCYSNNFGWQDVPFQRDLQRRLSAELLIANDAQCAALGEALYGAGKGCGRVAMFTIGTGVGGGFVKDGRIETDRYGSQAYIFGHMAIDAKGRLCSCGRQGCLEAHASARAVAGRGKGLYDEMPDAKQIFEDAAKGEHGACRIVDEFLDYLSIGVVNIANILRPEVIVIGGGVSASCGLILPRLNRELKKGVYGYVYTPVKAVCAALQNQAGIAGAAGLWEKRSEDGGTGQNGQRQE